jgi:hypothetical protein
VAISWLHLWVKKTAPVRKVFAPGRFLPQVEPLDARVLPAVTATFSAAGAVLRVIGDAQDNTVVVSRDAAGTILVNNGAVAIQGGTPTVANTQQIFLNGAAGNDNLSLDETNGRLPAASISGGDGNDVLAGGSGGNFVDGGAGSDTVFLGAGDDTFQWNPGDGSDTVEGQGGSDTLVFNGSDLPEKFDLSANGDHVRLTRDVGNVTMDLHGIAEIDLNALGGADTVSVNGPPLPGLAVLNLDLSGSTGSGDGAADAVSINGSDGDDVLQVTASGGGTGIAVVGGLFAGVNITGAEAANDQLTVNALGGDDVVNAGALPAGVIGLTINGGTGSDTLIGSAGNDLVTGGPGNDLVFLGAGDDTFAWNPGDGNDTVDGEGGANVLQFNGSDAGERIDLAANGSRVRLTDDVDGVTLDLNGLQTVDVNALGGADTITVNDLAGTDLTVLNLDLHGSAGGGDGRADTVIVNGSSGTDHINVNSSGGIVTVRGLPAFIKLTGSEGDRDQLIVNGLGGDDVINASTLAPGVTRLTLDGGAGNDSLVGSRGDDTILGGDGDDFAEPFRGNDHVDLGAGNDTFEWTPDDGSDVVEGQDGSDTLILDGEDDSETFALSANGNRVLFTFDGGADTIDFDGVEAVDLNAFGGADTVTVNDTSATDLAVVNLDLHTSAQSTGQADAVIINGTDRDDTVRIATLFDGTTIAVAGLLPTVNITGAQGTSDHLTVNTLGGNDVVDSSGLPADLIGLTVNLGDGQGTATTTALRISTATPVFGQAVLLTATVDAAAGVPIGTVTFLDGTTVLGTARVDAAGQATLTVALGVGGHALTASFAGTGGFAGGTSAAVTETVTRAATTVTLGSSVNPAVAGQAVTFTATVTAVAPGTGTPTGMVTFQDGTVILGSVAVGAGGRATIVTSFATAGGHAITAIYSGDANFVSSTQTLTEQVSAAATLAPTMTALVASANPVRVRRTVTFTATVRGTPGAGTPTGTVTFFVGNRAVAAARLDANGQARLTGFFSAAGLFTIRAVYGGDRNFAPSSQALTEQVRGQTSMTARAAKRRAGSASAWHTTATALPSRRARRGGSKR